MTKLPCIDIVHSLPGCGGRAFNNLGLCYIAAALRKDGFDTRYHDFVSLSLQPGSGFFDFFDDLMQHIYRDSAAAVGVADLNLLSDVLFPERLDSALAATIRAQVNQALSRLEGARVVCLSFNMFTTYFTAALGVALRQRNAVVLLGGPNSYYAPIADLMLRLGAADALIVGEGELSAAMALRALIHGRTPRGVPGARWVENGAVRAEPIVHPPIDTIPGPLFDGGLLGGEIPVLASRGCIRSCAYCSAPWRYVQPGCRRRSPKEVDAEMHSHASLYGIEDFFFNDNMLNSSRLWMGSLMQQLSHGRFLWNCQAEPSGLDEPMIECMRRAGCASISFGVQSFSPSLLRRMNRSVNVKGIIETIISVYRLGIQPLIDIIVGHPGETDEDHQRTLEAVEEVSQETDGQVVIKLFLFHLAPGSEIDRFPDRFGVTIRYADPDNFVLPLARSLRAVEPYAIGWHSNVMAEQAEQRAASLLTVCRRCGIRAETLGRKTEPETPAHIDSVREPSHTVRKALADGMVSMSLPALVLRADSNLRMHADPGKIRLLAGPGYPSEAYVAAIDNPALGAGLRILGGEASLVPVLLANLLAAARRRMVPCTLETNGLRFSQPSFVKSIVRSGLTRAIVLLLGLDRETADELGGLDGSFNLALEGARQLIAAGVSTQLGIVLSKITLNNNLPKLVELAENSAPGHSGLQVIVTRLVGQGAPALPSLTLTEPSIEQLVEAATVNRTGIVIEDRTLQLAFSNRSQI